MKTTAEWFGDHLQINWFGMKALLSDQGARWTGTHLVFYGTDESMKRKLDEKPTAEEALDIISCWQNY